MNKSKSLISGFTLAAILILWSIANHYSTVNTLPAAMMCVSLPMVSVLTIVFITRHHNRITFRNAVLPTLITGLTAAACVGLSYFLYTTVNPGYITETQAIAADKWQQLDYTNTQNQIENTTRFTNNISWAGTLFLFHASLYLATATVTLSIIFLQRQARYNRAHRTGIHMRG